MSEEVKDQTGGLSIGSIDAETVKAAGGNIIEDNSVGKIDNTNATIDGGQTNTTNNNTSEAAWKQSLNDMFDDMTTNAPELTTEQKEELENIKAFDPIDTSIEPPANESVDTPKTSVSYDFSQEEIPEFENNEDHPLMVKAMIDNMSEDASEEEQRSLFHKMTSSIKKYATSDVAIGAAKLTHVGIQALTVTPPPYNIIGPVLGAAIKMMGA